MSFHATAEEDSVHLEGSHLTGRLRNEAGDFIDTHIDLDTIIGNVDGKFAWDGSGFFGTAENVSFSFEGGDNVPVLRADLRDVEGEFKVHDINLAERIQNVDGQFQFI